MVKNIILLSGRMGSGKTELAKHLAKNAGYSHKSLATEIKKICCLITGRETIDKSIDRNLLQQLNILKQPFHKKNYEMVDKWINMSEAFSKYFDVNNHLIFQEDFFVNKLIANIDADNSLEKVVIDDVRFPIEPIRLSQRYGEGCNIYKIMLYCDIETIIKRLTQRDKTFDVSWLSHVSEQSFYKINFDYMFNTDKNSTEKIYNSLKYVL